MGAELLEGAGRVDAVVAVGAALEGEGEDALGAPGASLGWRARGQAEVIEDAARYHGVVDGRDQLHRTVAPRAVQRVDAPRPAQQGGPRQATRTTGVVRAHEVGCYWPVRPVSRVGRDYR